MKTNEKQEYNIYKNKHYFCKVHLSSVCSNTSLFFQLLLSDVHPDKI